jgi:hypothetical protein
VGVEASGAARGDLVAVVGIRRLSGEPDSGSLFNDETIVKGFT